VSGTARSLRPAIIIDVDGTLADVSGIRHYVADPRNRNFTKFHAAASYVDPHHAVVAVARALHDRGFTIIVVTARRSRWRYATTVWLRKWEIDYDLLLMRRDADGRPDVEVKREILARIRRDFTVVLAIDDNPGVLQLWRTSGIPAVRVPGWTDD